MWPFKKGLNSEERAEIQQNAEELNRIIQGPWDAFGVFREGVSKLYENCFDERGIRLDYKPHGVDELVNPARDAVRTLHQRIESACEELKVLAPPSWYPKRFRRVYEDWVDCLEAAKPWLDMADDALAEDVALEVRWGNLHRVNMFVTGVGEVGKIFYGLAERDHRFPSS